MGLVPNHEGLEPNDWGELSFGMRHLATTGAIERAKPCAGRTVALTRQGNEVLKFVK